MIMKKLTIAWGSVAISCEDDQCAVSDGLGSEFVAPTLIRALRLAYYALKQEGKA